MRILGIDPGYAIVGYGALDYNAGRFGVVEFGAITTQAHTLFEERLVSVYDEMAALLERTRPEALAIETLFYAHNQSTVIYVAEARGSSCWPPAKRGCRCSNTRRCRSNRRWPGMARRSKSRCRR